MSNTEFKINCVPVDSEAGQKYLQQAKEAGDVLPVFDCNGIKFIPIPGEMIELIVDGETASLASIIFATAFDQWMEALKQQAYRRSPQDYKQGDKFIDEYFKKTYFVYGFTPQDAWTDYTTMIL